jgi:branched-chain amino acid transport system ATP-binding protein
MTRGAGMTIRDLSASRGGSQVLHRVNFDVPANGVTALLGRNGSGKTTTLLALLGLVPATGEVGFDGDASFMALPTERRVGLGIGYVPENREVFGRLTVKENLELALRGKDVAANLDRVFTLFPILKARLGQLAGTMSGGQQQMLATARAFLNDNRLLLIDEPTTGLAPAIVNEVIEALRVAKVGTTMVLVEQNLRVAQQLADHLVILGNGQVVHTGSIDDLVTRPALTQRWLGVDLSARDEEPVHDEEVEWQH